MRVVNLEEYANLPRPQIDWLVPKTIPRPGLIALIGPEKGGKSFLALDLGIRLSRGETILGYPARLAAKVLYLQFDTSEAIWRDRIRELDASGYDIHAPNLLMVHPEDQLLPFNIVSASGRAWLSEVLTASNPDLVIIDVLREIHTKDENNSTEMKLVGDALTEAFTGRSVILVHHTKKITPDMAESSNISLLSRGSTYLTGKVDAMWLLYEQRLKMVNRFDSGRVLRCQQQTNGIFNFPDLADDATKRAQLDTLRASNPSLTKPQLAEKAMELGISASTFWRLVQYPIT